jgi:hypothetical protein
MMSRPTAANSICGTTILEKEASDAFGIPSVTPLPLMEQGT